MLTATNRELRYSARCWFWLVQQYSSVPDEARQPRQSHIRSPHSRLKTAQRQKPNRKHSSLYPPHSVYCILTSPRPPALITSALPVPRALEQKPKTSRARNPPHQASSGGRAHRHPCRPPPTPFLRGHPSTSTPATLPLPPPPPPPAAAPAPEGLLPAPLL